MLTSVSYLSTQIKNTSLQAAEYQLKTASTTILQRIVEIDSLVNWCVITPSVRTPMLTNATHNGANSVYTLLSNKYNSMSTELYLQRFLVSSTNGYFVMMGTASTRSSGVNRQNLSLLPGMGEGEEATAWEQLIDDPLMQANTTMQGIPVTRTMSSSNGSHTLSIYISVSPTVITDVLKGFSLEEHASLFWYMGDTVYQVDGSLLTPISLEEFQLEEMPSESVTPSSRALWAPMDYTWQRPLRIPP